MREATQRRQIPKTPVQDTPNLGRPIQIFKTFGRFPTRKYDGSRPSSREARGRRTRAPAYGGGDRVTPAATLRLRGGASQTQMPERPDDIYLFSR